MLIRKKIHYSVLAALLLVGCAGGLLFYTFSQAEKMLAAESHLGLINRELSNLEIITYEFWINRSPRAGRQWHTRCDLLQELLRSYVPYCNEEVEAIEQALARLDDSRTIFDQLLARLEGMQAGTSQFHQRFVAEQLASQLLNMFQSMMDDLELLAHHSTEKLESDLQIVGLLLALVFSCIFLIVMVMAAVIFRSVLSPLDALKEGTRRVSRMELDYRLPARRGDELGAIGDSFNTMAEALQLEQHRREEQGWVRDRLLDFERLMRGVGRDTLAQALLSHLAKTVEVPVAVLYLRDENGRFHWAAGRSWDKEQCRLPGFVEGEGLLGQAVRDNRVIELALVAPLTENQRQFLEQAAERAAVILRTRAGVRRAEEETI